MRPAAEYPLPGGNVAATVVRVGDSVRKPAGSWTPAVESLLAHLEASGFAGAPRALGTDERGRHVLEHVPGMMAHDLPPLDQSGLHKVGGLIAAFHDASETFQPPPGARWQTLIPPDREDLICHHDLAPWNLVIGADRWAFIDWDGAGPGSRLWDLAYAMTGFVPLASGGDPAVDGPRIRALADGYGLTLAQRRELPSLIAAHTRGMFDVLRGAAVTGAQPWARLYAEGHGDYWGPAAAYIERHLGTWAAALGA
ncbi:MAG: phosphotransferase enzyme family protein [Streptosporangiaceae bacterium]